MRRLSFPLVSALLLATSNADRSQANAANLDALNSLNFDLTTFNDWFTAYVAGNKTAMAIAEKRFSRNFHSAFNAWQATDPETNPDAPPGPTYMPEYRQPQKVLAAKLNAKATNDYNAGQRAGQLGQLRPHHRLPCHRAVPGRDRQPFFIPGHPLWPGRRGQRHTGPRYRAPRHRPKARLGRDLENREGTGKRLCVSRCLRLPGRIRRVGGRFARSSRPQRDLNPATTCTAWVEVRRDVSMNICVSFLGLVPNW